MYPDYFIKVVVFADEVWSVASFCVYLITLLIATFNYYDYVYDSGNSEAGSFKVFVLRDLEVVTFLS